MVHVEDGNVELRRIRSRKSAPVQAHVFEEVVLLVNIGSFLRSEGQTVLGLGIDEAATAAKFVPLLVDRELAVGAGAMLRELARVIDLFSRAELIHDVIHELE